ncbi:unnamed protein product [Moneuplotes crassus]|uniref:HSA domain-containing protein n=1 Tax=Euplotes crassus TaxID=5936 RepID=A0AAD1Y2W9_EUPCR|nr:unnamed protein product [Moneuplotes crassus]
MSTAGNNGDGNHQNRESIDPDDLWKIQKSQNFRASTKRNSSRAISQLRIPKNTQKSQPNPRYMVNNNVNSRYHPSRSSLHNKRALTTRDITKALSQGQQRGPFTYQDYKEKWDRIKSKDGKIIRGFLEPYKAKHQEPSRVKTHWDYVLDEVEYMYIDFKEELKFKKSLASKFIHEISNFPQNRTKNAKNKELCRRLKSIQMGSMIQSTFSKIKNNNRLDLNPEILMNINDTIRKNDFHYQLSESRINTLKAEYDETAFNTNGENMGSSHQSVLNPETQVKEEQITFGEEHQQDELMPLLNRIDPEHFTVQDFDETQENNNDSDNQDYYYPMTTNDTEALLGSDNLDGGIRDIELELLPSFYRSNSSDNSIQKAKNFLISHHLVNHEKDINVMRGPFIKYKIKCVENEEELGGDNDDLVIEYVQDKIDQEIKDISELFTEAPINPQNNSPDADSCQKSVLCNDPPLPYQIPTRKLPPILTTKQPSPISITALITEKYQNPSKHPSCPGRKRKRNQSPAPRAPFPLKKPRPSSPDLCLLEITANDSEYRKNTFKTYCKLLKFVNQIKADPSVPPSTVKQYEFRLSKGLLTNFNKDPQSKFKMIVDLYGKDRGQFLEKRRLLSLFQTVWGAEHHWNKVSRETINRTPLELMEAAQHFVQEIPEGNNQMPKEIWKNLRTVIEKYEEAEREQEAKATPKRKFLRLLMKPYNELHPVERLELYQNEANIYEGVPLENNFKRNLILSYQWKKMETSWFQENMSSHPCLKKPFNDPEIEADLKGLMEKIIIIQQHSQARNDSHSTRNLHQSQK